jgi:hypothetical protein
LALPGRGPELGVWRPWNPGIGGLGPVWPGLGRFPGLADFGVPETTKFPLLPGYRKTRFWGPPTGNSRNSVEFSKKQQKTAYFPLLQANSGGYPPQTGQFLGPGGQFWGPRPGEANSGVRDPRIRDSPRFVHFPEIGRFPGFLGFGRIRRIPRFRVFWHFPGIGQFQEIRGFPQFPDSGRLPEFGVWADSRQMLESQVWNFGTISGGSRNWRLEQFICSHNLAHGF